jgi:NAD/NADP transhydrogenase alpha subunit
MNTNDNGKPVTNPQPQETTTIRSDYDLGLVANDHDSEETRFLLTPEVCGLLCSSNLAICMENGAASSISYTDEKYASFGVQIVERETALLAEYVLSYAPLNAADVMKMKDGAKLLCMFDAMLFRKDVLEALNSKNICVLSSEVARVCSSEVCRASIPARCWYLAKGVAHWQR